MSAIARATLADLEALLPLVQAYRVFYGRTPNEARERSVIEAHLRDGTSVIFMARAGEQAIGFAQIFGYVGTVHLGPALILEDLFVLPAARRGGVAAALLGRALEHARAAGATGMFLETASDNETAQRVYQRMGWQREGRFLKYNAPL